MTWLLALQLMQLTGLNEQVIYVAPSAIVSLRRPRGTEHFGPTIECLINTADGKFIAVREPCEVVLRMME